MTIHILKWLEVYLLSNMGHPKAPRRVAEFADEDFVSLDEDTLVAEAARIMYERDVCSVVVTRNDRERSIRLPIGIITSRDVLQRVVAQSKGPFKLTIKDIMSTPLIIIEQDASIRDAILLMKGKNIARLPVLNESGEVLGLVSWRNLVDRVSPEDMDAITA